MAMIIKYNIVAIAMWVRPMKGKGKDLELKEKAIFNGNQT